MWAQRPRLEIARQLKVYEYLAKPFKATVTILKTLLPCHGATQR